MKNKKGLIIVIIVLLSVLTLAVTGLFVTLLILNGKNPSRMLHIGALKKNASSKAIEEVYEADFDKIEIQSVCGDVKIHSVDENQAKLVVYGKKDCITVDTADNQLKVRVKESKKVNISFFSLGTGTEATKVELYLPKEYGKTISVTNNYGDIEIENFRKATISVKEDCGDVEVEGAKELSVVNKLGDVKVDFVGAYLNIEDNCGDIKIKKVNLSKDSFIKNDLGDVQVGETNDIFIDAKTDLGDVKIASNNRKADIVLKIENDCGDIKVKNGAL